MESPGRIAPGRARSGPCGGHIHKRCAILVLSRKERQSIKIGDNITITIHRIKGSVVRLAIEAPKDVPIKRDDLKENSK